MCSTDLIKLLESHTELVNIILGHLNKILFQKCSTDLKINLQFMIINLPFRSDEHNFCSVNLKYTLSTNS